MSCVSNLLNRWIGSDALFPTQRAMAEAAKLQGSTLNRTLKGSQMEPATLSKLLSCLGLEQRKDLMAAQIRDVIPEDYLHEVMDESLGAVAERVFKDTMSPLAEKTLEFLSREACRDAGAQALLEQLGRWVGLDAVEAEEAAPVRVSTTQVAGTHLRIFSGDAGGYAVGGAEELRVAEEVGVSPAAGPSLRELLVAYDLGKLAADSGLTIEDFHDLMAGREALDATYAGMLERGLSAADARVVWGMVPAEGAGVAKKKRARVVKPSLA